MVRTLLSGLSCLFLGIGMVLVLSPFALYWFIHGDYERYIWIINGPFPFSHLGGGPFQLLVYAGLAVSGLIFMTASFIIRSMRTITGSDRRRNGRMQVMFSRKGVRACLPLLMAFFLMVLAACNDSSAVVTKRDGGEVSYPFSTGGFLTAVSWGDREAVKMFLQRGWDINGTDSDGNSGLHAAADKKDSQMVRILIEAGADPNLQNNKGYTALMLAAANNEPDILTMLLNAGADPSLRNEAGETAADIAEDLGHTEIIKLVFAETG